MAHEKWPNCSPATSNKSRVAHKTQARHAGLFSWLIDLVATGQARGTSHFRAPRKSFSHEKSRLGKPGRPLSLRKRDYLATEATSEAAAATAEAASVTAEAASEAAAVAAEAVSVAAEAASVATEAASVAAEAAPAAASSAFLPQAASAIAAISEASRSDFFMLVSSKE
jgi:hypothetical protein